jgi:serine/threonine-protein kinase
MGIILWEALAGRRLFEGTSSAEMMNQVLTRPIDPPGAHTRFEVPSALEGVALRALERNRELRFASARDMVIALEEAIPPATARQVADWMEHAFPERLQQHRSVLARIENGIGLPAAPPALAVAEGMDEGITETAESPPPRGRIPPRAIRAAALALVVAGAIGAGSAIVRARTTPTAARREPGTAASLATPIASASANANANANAMTGAPSDDVLPPSAPPLASASPHPRARGHRPRPPNCATPFTIDSSGVRIPRPECF